MDLYQWRCSCGTTSHRKPVSLFRARENMRKHVWRARSRDAAIHEAAFELWEPERFEPKAYVPQPRGVCPVCSGNWPMTSRGTLWRHRPNPEVRTWCPGGGPRAPYPPKRKGPRPDLAIDMREFAIHLLAILRQQDRKRAMEQKVPRRGTR